MRPVCSLLLAAAAALLPASALIAAVPSPNAVELPSVFKETFLDIRADVADAAREGKRVMLYFGQDGCPYCRQLLQVNFGQKDIADRVRQSLYPIALNMWGDREVTWLDGKAHTEKTLAAALKVQFTPTLLFLDETGRVVARINGYYPPHRFQAAIDYVAGRMESKTAFAEHMRTAVKEPASGVLHDEPFFLRAPLDLTRKAASKPLAVFFEQAHCAACDEMHAHALKANATRSILERFDVARIDLFGKAPLVTPDGRRSVEAQWGRALGVAYTPAIVLFEAGGREIFRIEGYVRALHLQSALDYVASGAHRSEPSFQRYVQNRTEQLRKKGADARIW